MNLTFSEINKQITKDTVTITSRLLSIKHDSKFVKGVFEKLPKKTKKMANLRCGLWYHQKFDSTCYFKSTDGHAYHWNFSTSRLNLNVVQEIIQNEIVAIVDSTRKGKLLPDSISKTIPIWAYVLNSVINKIGNRNWSFELDLPKGISKNEKSQIEDLIPKFIENFRNCGLDFESILLMQKPMKCFFVSPVHQFKEFEEDVSNLNFHPLILICASDPSFDEKTFSWRYIQGAGDDHQTWGKGLTPELFWKFEDEILEDEEFISEIIDEKNAKGAADKLQNYVKKLTQIGNTNLFIGSSICEIPSEYATIFCCIKPENKPEISLYVEISDSKKNKSLENNLNFAMEFIKEHIKSSKIAIICSTGNNESVCVACAALALFYNEKNNFDENGSKKLSKQYLRSNMSYISSFVTSATPSRNLMKQLNRYFLSK
eukprot:gene10975-3682_t